MFKYNNTTVIFKTQFLTSIVEIAKVGKIIILLDILNRFNVGDKFVIISSNPMRLHEAIGDDISPRESPDLQTDVSPYT